MKQRIVFFLLCVSAGVDTPHVFCTHTHTCITYSAMSNRTETAQIKPAHARASPAHSLHAGAQPGTVRSTCAVYVCASYVYSHRHVITTATTTQHSSRSARFARGTLRVLALTQTRIRERVAATNASQREHHHHRRQPQPPL